MAINFLDNLQLNQNQLLGARLQVETADTNISGPVSGQIIYNSTSNKFKYYNGTSWVDPTQGSYTSWTLTGGSGSYSIVNNATVNISGGTGITTGIINPTGTIFVANVSLSDISGVSGSYTLANITVDAQGRITSASSGTAGGMTSWNLSGDTGSQTITNGNTVDIAGGVGIVTAATATDTLTVTVDLEELPSLSPAGGSNDSLIFLQDGSDQAKAGIDSFPINEFGAANGALNMSSNQINNLATPTGTTDAATKAYVDSAVAGGLNVKGGFNANTGAIATGGNLTSGSSRVAVAIGDYYVVTVAGNFFGNAATPLTPGDSVLVQTAAAAGASVEGDFAVIQSDTDLATAATPGLASFPTSGGLTVNGGAVSITGIGSAGTGGASASATTGVTINARGQVTGFTSQTISIPSTQINNFNTATDARITARQFKASNTSSGTSHVFTHNLATTDVIVQLYDVKELSPTNGQTIITSVDRTSSNAVTVTTASSIAASTIRALIIKVD